MFASEDAEPVTEAVDVKFSSITSNSRRVHNNLLLL
jgi:hypothetical protein